MSETIYGFQEAQIKRIAKCVKAFENSSECMISKQKMMPKYSSVYNGDFKVWRDNKDVIINAGIVYYKDEFISIGQQKVTFDLTQSYASEKTLYLYLKIQNNAFLKYEILSTLIYLQDYYLIAVISNSSDIVTQKVALQIEQEQYGMLSIFSGGTASNAYNGYFAIKELQQNDGYRVAVCDGATYNGTTSDNSVFRVNNVTKSCAFTSLNVTSTDSKMILLHYTFEKTVNGTTTPEVIQAILGDSLPNDTQSDLYYLIGRVRLVKVQTDSSSSPDSSSSQSTYEINITQDHTSGVIQLFAFTDTCGE